MTIEIIKKIIDDTLNSKNLLDVQKADLIRYLVQVYHDIASQIENDIEDLIQTLD